MKYSKYNIYVEKGQYVIGYNTMTENIIVLPKKISLDLLSNKDNVDILKETNTNLFNALVDNDFIISKNRDELSELRIENKINTITAKDYHLTLIPSLDCNLKCWYCYENHITNSKMSENTISRITEHIELKIENNELNNLVLDWFGGEPLLYFNEVTYPLSIKLKNILEKNKLTLHSFFVTNGSLINDDMIDKLSEINSRFQITLDGNKKRHDKIRYSKENEKGTYDKIIKSLYNITQKIDETYINIRINYDEKTLKGVEDIIRDLKDIDRRKVNIHLERIWQTKPDPNNLDLKNALDLIVSNGFSSTYLNFTRRPYRCKAERLNQAVIIYDGSVYKCSGRDFSIENIDGILEEKGIIQWNQSNLSKRIGLSTFENKKCLDCKLLPICMGPCSQKLIEHDWNIVDHICPLSSLEMPLDEFVIYKYNNVSNLKKIYNV